MGNIIVSLIFGAIVGGIAMAIFGEGAGVVIGGIAFVYALIKVPSLSRKQNENLARVRQHLDETIRNDMRQAADHSMHFDCAVFIDSIFVKQTISEIQRYYPNIREEDISIEAIVRRLISYTNYMSYAVFYFDVQSQSLRPNINMGIAGKVSAVAGKKVKVEVVKSQLVASEICDFITAKKSKYSKHVLIADDVIYGQVLLKRGGVDNLTVFRRREGSTRMSWDYYDKHGYFIDIIDEIAKEKQQQHA